MGLPNGDELQPAGTGERRCVGAIRLRPCHKGEGGAPRRAGRGTPHRWAGPSGGVRLRVPAATTATAPRPRYGTGGTGRSPGASRSRGAGPAHSPAAAVSVAVAACGRRRSRPRDAVSAVERKRLGGEPGDQASGQNRAVAPSRSRGSRRARPDPARGAPGEAPDRRPQTPWDPRPPLHPESSGRRQSRCPSPHRAPHGSTGRRRRGGRAGCGGLDPEGPAAEGAATKGVARTDDRDDAGGAGRGAPAGAVRAVAPGATAAPLPA